MQCPLKGSSVRARLNSAKTYWMDSITNPTWSDHIHGLNSWTMTDNDELLLKKHYVFLYVPLEYDRKKESLVRPGSRLRKVGFLLCCSTLDQPVQCDTICTGNNCHGRSCSRPRSLVQTVAQVYGRSRTHLHQTETTFVKLYILNPNKSRCKICIILFIP